MADALQIDIPSRVLVARTAMDSIEYYDLFPERNIILIGQVNKFYGLRVDMVWYTPYAQQSRYWDELYWMAYTMFLTSRKYSKSPLSRIRNIEFYKEIP